MLLVFLPGGPLTDPLPDIDPGPFTVRLDTIVSGLVFPTSAAVPLDGSDRIFVTEVTGLVRVVEDGALLPTPFVDLTADFHGTNGSAMSSLAFHPDFASNRKLYVVHTELEDPLTADFGATTGVAQQSVLYELEAMGDHPDPASNLADLSAKRELLRINEQSTIHNLDALAFGPDGYLYATKGDDRRGGQNPKTIHGTVLRIDVDFRSGNPVGANGQYAIPADNPFVGAGGRALEEIFAYGFRNPWRMTFDRATGALWVTDVGDLDIEEVNRVVAGGNFGWDAKEGSFAHIAGGGVRHERSPLPGGPYVDPVGEYDHTQVDRSVTGGVLYRGWQHPELGGSFVCGDWISGRLFTMDPATGVFLELSVDPAGATINGHLSGSPVEGVVSIDQDAHGEPILVVTQRDLTSTGRLLRMRPSRRRSNELAPPEWALRDF